MNQTTIESSRTLQTFYPKHTCISSSPGSDRNKSNEPPPSQGSQLCLYDALHPPHHSQSTVCISRSTPSGWPYGSMPSSDRRLSSIWLSWRAKYLRFFTSAVRMCLLVFQLISMNIAAAPHSSSSCCPRPSRISSPASQIPTLSSVLLETASVCLLASFRGCSCPFRCPCQISVASAPSTELTLWSGWIQPIGV